MAAETLPSLDKDSLLKQVRRANCHAERARLEARAQQEARLAELADEAEASAQTARRLRGDPEGATALRRRDTALREMGELQRALDPRSELLAVDAAISAAQRQQSAAEREDAAEYVGAARSVLRRLNPAADIYPHPKAWSRDAEAGDVLSRGRTPLGESDPSLLRVEWTRFDFKPPVPWRTGREAELETVTSGLVTYHTKKSDRIEAHARESRERLMSRGSSRGGLGGTARSGGGTSGGGGDTGGASARSGGFSTGGGGATWGPRPTSAMQGPGEGEGDAGVAEAGSSAVSGERPASRPLTVTRPTSGAGGIINVTMRLPAARGSGAPPPFKGFGPSHLPLVPGATVLRRTLTLRPLRPSLLATLSPEQLRKPLHPAYLLSSVARHGAAWRKPDPAGSMFSEPPADKAPTQNEIVRARDYMVPDRAFYNPQRDGKPPFLKTEPQPYPLFGNVATDLAWMQLHGSEEDTELRKRFYAQLDAQNGGGYAGEDAFDAPANAGTGSATKSRAALADERAAAARPLFNAKSGLPPSPDERLRTTSRERLRTGYPLGIVAAEEAETARQHVLVGITHRLQGAGRRGPAVAPDDSSSGFGHSSLPPALFTGRARGVHA